MASYVFSSGSSNAPTGSTWSSYTITMSTYQDEPTTGPTPPQKIDYWAETEEDGRGLPHAHEVMWLPEAIYAFRGWNLRRGAVHSPTPSDRYKLQGAVETWQGKYMAAKCKKDTVSGPVYSPGTNHSSPDMRCMCGLNAYKDAMNPELWDYPVLGIVSMYGRVIEFERGYRSSHGEILELALYSEVAETDPGAEVAFRERYKVPVHVATRVPWLDPKRASEYEWLKGV